MSKNKQKTQGKDKGSKKILSGMDQILKDIKGRQSKLPYYGEFIGE